MRTDGLLRCTQRVLWIAGALLCGFCAGLFLEGRLFQALEDQRLEEERRSRERQPIPSPFVIPKTPRAIGGLVGRLAIPRLQLSAIVLEGGDDAVLRLGVGRVLHTADPGEPGNVVLGGHRDTFFRPLRQIRTGDAITLVTPESSFRYVVEWTEIVNPDDSRVLAPTPRPSLTLVTCYPFRFVGPAPQRFIVRARQVAPSTDSAAVSRISHPAMEVY
jgi:sortase A